MRGEVHLADKKQLEVIFNRLGFTDFKWINAKDIKVAQWVRFRCRFGCGSYGNCGTCPPQVPGIEECREMIAEYDTAAIFHFAKQVEKPEERADWSRETHLSLCGLEREVFLAGYYKTFLITFDRCRVCDPCPGNRAECKDPAHARPGADAMGIDVFATVRSVGYEIQVLKEKSETMNRYAFLLIE